jgi:hypothetical protein
VKDEKPIALIRACAENTGVLTATRRWLGSERETVLSHLGDAEELVEMYRLQGEARCLRRLSWAIAQMTREKGDVLSEQQPIRRVR